MLSYPGKALDMKQIFISYARAVDALREPEVQARYPQIEKRYLELAVFRPGAPVPEAAVTALWGASQLDPSTVQDYVDALVERSLLRRAEGARIGLHDLQADYVRAKVGNPAGLHRRLLDAYRGQTPQGWASGPNDGYFFEHLPFHLREAKGQGALAALLFDYRWLRAKLKATDSWQLSTDFDLLKNHGAGKLVQQALEMSASCLAQSPEQLAPHLCGRLADSRDPAIRKLIEQVKRSTQGPWLRPLTPCLPTPGGPLQRILDAGLSWITCLARLPSGELACGSHDGALYLWNLESGRRREFTGHDHWIEALVVTPDGRLISGGADRTLREWDTATGASRVLLSRRAAALALLPGGAIAGAGYRDGLWVWKPGSVKPQLLEGHEGDAAHVVALPDGRLVSSGKDTLRIWQPDLRSSRGWTARKDGLRALAVTSSGKILLGGNDGAILELDPDTLAERELARHDKYLDVLAPTRGWVASATSKGIHVWPYREGAAAKLLSATGVKSLEWISKDLLAAGGYDGKVRLFNVDNAASTPSLEHSGPVRALGVTASGWAVLRREEGPVLGWHYRRRSERKILDAREIYGSLGIASNGLLLRHAAHGSGLIASTPGRGARHRYPWSDSEWYVEMAAASGTRVIGAQADPGRIWVWDKPGTRPKVLKVGDVVSDVKTNRLRQIIASSYDGTVRIWQRDLNKSRLLEKKHREEDEDGAASVAISDDGRWAAVGLIGGVVHLWDLRLGHCTDLVGHVRDFVLGLAFLPGKLLLSGGRDSTLRLWSLETAKELACLALESTPDHVVVHRSGTVIVGDYGGRVYALEVRGVPKSRQRRR